MSDAPAAAVFCGEMCNGCQDDCAACATMACGDCGGCEHGRLSRRARVAGAALTLLQIGNVPAEFGFNPNQLRGPDGRFIKMGGRGSAGKGGLPKGSGLKNPRVDGDGRPVGSSGGGAGAGGSAPVPEAVPTPAPLAADDRGPRPVGFTPRSDKDWNLVQKRLDKRTPRTDLEGDLQPGDIVPTRDGKWQKVLGKDTSKFGERYGLIRVRDDAKGYEHTEDPVGVKRQIEAYAAEKAWRDAGGSSDRLAGVSTAPVNAEGLRPGEPPIGPDGKYAKPVKMYAVHNGQVYTRTTRNPYRYASVVSFRNPNHPDAEGRHDTIWSWHRTADSAAKGTLTSSQRKGLYVSKVVETGFEDPGTGRETSVDAPPSTVAPAPRAASTPLAKGSSFIHQGEAVTVTGSPYWDNREGTWVVPTRNARGVGQRIAVGGDRGTGPQAPQAAAAPASTPTRQHLDSYSRQIEATARMIRDAVVDGEGPFDLDKYKERELSDRLQELSDARSAGNSDRVDRVTAQIRKLLLDTDVQTEDELPRVPGQTGPTPKLTSSQAVDIIDGLFRQPVGDVLYEDDQTMMVKENEDEDLRVTNKQTGKNRVIRAIRVDAGTINEAVGDLAKP